MSDTKMGKHRGALYRERTLQRAYDRNEPDGLWSRKRRLGCSESGPASDRWRLFPASSCFVSWYILLCLRARAFPVLVSLSIASLIVQLLQKGNANNATEPTVTATTTATTATGALSCGELDPKSVAPPENAVLYLSLRGPGVITYKCVEANKPVVLEESADLTETISKGWSGKVETKDGARYVEICSSPATD